MTDPGLNDRLRQKSRRAGLAVGLSMALAILICIGGATLIYAALIQPLSDLIPIERESSAPLRDQIQQLSPGEQAPEELGGSEPAPISAPEPAEAAQAAPPAAGDVVAASEAETSQSAPVDSGNQFTPTHQIGASQSVNFRAGPTRGDAIIVALPPSTPLQYLDEDAPTQDPSDGDRWMKFVTEDGMEGWVREIDVVTYQP